MRRWLLPALMMTLALSACTLTAPERKIEEQRRTLAAASELAVTADVEANLGDEVFSCTLRCTATPETAAVEVLAPETVAGIRAVLDAEGTTVEYEGVALGVGAENSEIPSPLCALPRLLHALRAGSVLRTWTEWEGERTLFVESYYVTDDTDACVWYDGETLSPKYAEFRRGGQMAVRCVITDFTWN